MSDPGLASEATPDNPKYPDVSVTLSGKDGNAFAILGCVGGALRRAGYGDQVDDFMAEAMDGDYDHLLRTCMCWVAVT